MVDPVDKITLFIHSDGMKLLRRADNNFQLRVRKRGMPNSNFQLRVRKPFPSGGNNFQGRYSALS